MRMRNDTSCTQRVHKNMESSAAREIKLQRRRERERAHRAAETAAEKEERLRKRRKRDQEGELQKHKNRDRQDFRESALGRAKIFLSELKNSEGSD